MSQPHHPDPIEENAESHPVKLAIALAIGIAALVIGIILLTQFAVGVYGARSRKDDPAMAPDAVKKRIAPVAQVVVDPNAAPAGAAPAASAGASPAPATTVASAAPAAAPAAAPKAEGAAANGKATFDTVCTACHTAGVAGAPKFGDKATWAPRIKTGKEALYASALKGKGAMPPKGGNPALSDDAVKAAVDYMVSAAK